MSGPFVVNKPNSGNNKRHAGHSPEKSGGGGKYPQKKTKIEHTGNEEIIPNGGLDSYAPRPINSIEFRENYQKFNAEYEKKVSYYMYNEYTQNADSFLRKVAADKKVANLASKYPLLKILKSITKKFMLNDLEITFFALFLDENGWCYSDVQEWATKMTDFLNITEIKDPNEYKSLLLYLLFVAYAIKQYLNETTEMEIYDYHLLSLNSEFPLIYKNWMKNNSKYMKISPPMKINKIYKKYSLKYIDYGDEGYHEDFNALVDNIIQISPPYNNDKYDSQIGGTNPNSNPNPNPEVRYSNSSLDLSPELNNLGIVRNPSVISEFPLYRDSSFHVNPNYRSSNPVFSNQIITSQQLPNPSSNMDDKRNEQSFDDMPGPPVLGKSESNMSVDTQLPFVKGISSYLN